MKLIREHFQSIDEMLSVITSRPNNTPMNGRKESMSSDKNFTGTNSWEEAVNLYQYGYTDILEQVKRGVGAHIERTNPMTRRRVVTGVQGYAPHVPNSIMGLPNSMIYTESVMMKTKVVNIVYSTTENCGTEAEEFIKSGIAVLSVVNILELSGYRVNLNISFYCAKEDEEYTFGTVNVKDYREHMDIQKLCFPVAHPSMFRRMGFKWLETCVGLKNSGWARGYGSQVMFRNTPKEFKDEGSILLDLEIVRKNKYDPDKIIESMNLKK